MTALRYEILRRDTTTRARRGRVTTPHGSFETPAFMPVGTQGTVKGLLPALVEAVGSEIILGNTYHLMLRPGSELIAEMGGLHRWARWDRPMLTDSGGFQVFSLADINRVTEDGVIFRSHIDGATIDLSPERSIHVQNQLGADIIMAFDDCPPAMGATSPVIACSEALTGIACNPEDAEPDPSDRTDTPSRGTAGRHLVSPAEYRDRVAQACDRSVRWLARCAAAHQRPADQALFGIIQGGTDLAQRSACVAAMLQHDLPGWAIGGVAVGEGHAQLVRVVEHTAPLLPEDRPRYLMGVGYEIDILKAVQAGVDMFDCVMPTRNGRNANAFTPTGQMRLRNAKFARDPLPIDPACDCPACSGAGAAALGQGGAGASETGRGFSRSYLRHLFMAGEMLGPILVSLHNIRYFQRYLLDIREAIAHNDWPSLWRRYPVLHTLPGSKP